MPWRGQRVGFTCAVRIHPQAGAKRRQGFRFRVRNAREGRIVPGKVGKVMQRSMVKVARIQRLYLPGLKDVRAQAILYEMLKGAF